MQIRKKTIYDLYSKQIFPTLFCIYLSPPFSVFIFPTFPFHILIPSALCTTFSPYALPLTHLISCNRVTAISSLSSPTARVNHSDALLSLAFRLWADTMYYHNSRLSCGVTHSIYVYRINIMYTDKHHFNIQL